MPTYSRLCLGRHLSLLLSCWEFLLNSEMDDRARRRVWNIAMWRTLDGTLRLAYFFGRSPSGFRTTGDFHRIRYCSTGKAIARTHLIGSGIIKKIKTLKKASDNTFKPGQQKSGFRLFLKLAFLRLMCWPIILEGTCYSLKKQTLLSLTRAYTVNSGKPSLVCLHVVKEFTLICFVVWGHPE